MTDNEPLLLDTFDEEAPEADWAPPPQTHDHNGDALPPGLVFFAPPPPEIGEVLSARSSLAAHKRPMALISRLLLGGFAGSALVAVLHFAEIRDSFVSALVMAVCMGATLFLTRFRHAVSYVGTLGNARIECRGNTRRLARSTTFLFADATDLRTQQTANYSEGVYTGTTYSFGWTNAEGRTVFYLSGNCRNLKKPPRAKDPFHFATATERSWTAYLLPRAVARLRDEGEIRFPIKGDKWVALTPASLRFSDKKETATEWPFTEIGEVAAEQAQFKIKRWDAKEGWFQSQGVYVINCHTIANLLLFKTLFERLLLGNKPRAE